MRQREEIFAERRRLLRGNRFLNGDAHRGADQVIEKAAIYVQDALSRHVTTLPLSRAGLDKRVAALDAELAETEREDRKRPLLEQRALVDEQLAALETD